jgi:hypothetical protein
MEQGSRLLSLSVRGSAALGCQQHEAFKQACSQSIKDSPPVSALVILACKHVVANPVDAMGIDEEVVVEPGGAVSVITSWVIQNPAGLGPTANL